MHWLLIGAFVVLVLFALARMGGKHRMLWSPDHLRELSTELVRIKPEALSTTPEQIAAAARERPDELPPGAAVTSTKLTVVYSIRDHEGGKQHHLILSRQNVYLPSPAARFLVAAICEQLGLPKEHEVRLGRSAQGRYHALFSVDEAEHQALVDHEVTALDPDDAHELVGYALKRARDLRVVPFGPQGPGASA